MSSFAGLSTALSSLMAQRMGLEVAGQNIANASTDGYTRQRIDLAAQGGVTVPSMFSAGPVAGRGVAVVGIDRLADAFLDARLRNETSLASNTALKAEVLGRIEGLLREPGDLALSTQLQDYWNAWQDVANSTDDIAARSVLLERAQAVVDELANGREQLDIQWSQLRTQTSALVNQINTTSASIADLNNRIRAITLAGGNAHELSDQRDLLVTKLSELTGASAKHRDDGTIDVMVGGNALVRGATAHNVKLTGSETFLGIDAEPLALVWERSGHPAPLDGGRVAGLLEALAPSDGVTGGIIALAATRYDAVATELAASVNALHHGGITLPAPPATTGNPGGDFFEIQSGLDAGLPPALALRIAITNPLEIAAAAAGAGALDGSIADRIAQLATAADGPDAIWSAYVVDIGVRTRAATDRANVAESVRLTAENAQRASAAVDLDEETLQMLAYQRAYEGAARVLTAIDEMLDVLINRTGIVGR